MNLSEETPAFVCMGEMFTAQYQRIWGGFVLWCQGYLALVVGCVGFAGNVVTIVILANK